MIEIKTNTFSKYKIASEKFSYIQSFLIIKRKVKKDRWMLVYENSFDLRHMNATKRTKALGLVLPLSLASQSDHLRTWFSRLKT